jgi:hypothetical protein
MRTEDDLRSALTALEAEAPSVTAALAGVRGRSARRGRRAVYRLALPVAAGAAAVAVTVAIQSVPPSGHQGQAAPKQPRAEVRSARAILLAAATKTASTAMATGKYWRVREEYFDAMAAGTKAHPYDIFANTVRHDQWFPVASGQPMWDISQLLGAVPAAPADAAAWRAAGSPTSWTLPSATTGSSAVAGAAGVNKEAITTADSAPIAVSQDLGGVVGYVEGDEGGLTAAQFRALPATVAGLDAQLRHYAMLTWSAQHPGAGGATVDELIWAEAVSLLSDPVPPRVKAVAYRVMAGLPGVRSAGVVEDPLGRTGDAVGYPQADGSEDVVIVDLDSGALLADEDVITAPGTTTVRFGPFYGTDYPGRVLRYSALISASWTNASPHPPKHQITG